MDLNPLHWIDKINEEIGHSTADVLEFIGITNPAVDPDGIREVARHWKALGDALDDAHWHTGQALNELRWEGKAADAFHSRAKDVRDHCQKAAGVLHNGHHQLNQFANESHELISQIGVLCAQILEFELAALPLSLLTGPLSEVASNLAAGERAVKIIALISRIAEAAKTVDRAVEAILEALGALGRALKALTPLAKMAAGGVAMTVGYDAIADPDRLRHADSLEQDVEVGALLGIIGGGFGKGIQGALRGLGPRMVPALSGAGLLGDLGGEEGALSRLGAVMRLGDDSGGEPEPPKELPAGPVRKRTLDQVRKMRTDTWDKRREKFQAGEEYARESHGGNPEQHFPVPKNTDDPEFPVTTPKGRKVDCPVIKPDGSIDAVEVKTYNEWRTIKYADGSSAAQRGEVPLSPHIKEQINKDVWLARNHPGFRPRWEFLGAGPSQELRDYLIKANVLFVEYH